MANSSRKIIRGVRVGGKTYAAGAEDELVKVLDSESAQRLIAKGHIEGSWTMPRVEPVPSGSAEADAKETARRPAKEK